MREMRAQVPVEVHCQEARELQKARIDPPPKARVRPWHTHDRVALEACEWRLLREFVGLLGVAGGVDRRPHQDERRRTCRVAVLGHQAGGGHHRDAGLADGQDRDPLGHDPRCRRPGRPGIRFRRTRRRRTRPGRICRDELQHLDQVVGVVVEVEAPRSEGHIACVRPVGDEDVVLGQHRLDRAAQQRGVVPRHRRHDEDLRVADAGCGEHAAEMQETAEWLGPDHLLEDRCVDAVDQGRGEAELRLGVASGRVQEDFQGGRGVGWAGRTPPSG